MTRAQLYSVDLSLSISVILSLSLAFWVSSDSFITVSKCCSSWFWGDDGLESDAWTRKEILYHVPSMAFWECLEYKRADEDPPLSMSSWASHHCRNLMPDTHSESLFVQHTQTFTYCSYIYMSAYQPNLIGKRNLFTWWWFHMNMHDVIFWQKAWKSTLNSIIKHNHLWRISQLYETYEWYYTN